MITRGGKNAPVDSERITVRSGAIRRAVRIFGPARSGAGLYEVGLELDSAAAPHGPIQELGGRTRAHFIRARQAKALRFEQDGKVRFAKWVRHPGSRIPARPFMGPSVVATQGQALDLVERALAEHANKALGGGAGGVQRRGAGVA